MLRVLHKWTQGGENVNVKARKRATKEDRERKRERKSGFKRMELGRALNYRVEHVGKTGRKMYKFHCLMWKWHKTMMLNGGEKKAIQLLLVLLHAFGLIKFYCFFLRQKDRMDWNGEGRKKQNVIFLFYLIMENGAVCVKEAKMKYIYLGQDTHTHTYIPTIYLNKNMFQCDAFSLFFFAVVHRLFTIFFLLPVHSFQRSCRIKKSQYFFSPTLQTLFLDCYNKMLEFLFEKR